MLLQLIAVSLFLISEGLAQSSVSRITVTPQKISLTHNTSSTGTQLTVTCQPPVSGVTGVLSMDIKRLSFTDPDGTNPTTLVSASLLSGDGNAELSNSVSMVGASASGSTTSQTITLTMGQAKCSDQGIYICLVLYQSSETGVTATSRKEVPAEVGVGQARMELSSPPMGQSTWKVNDTITFTCTGPVGTVNTTGSTPDPQITWVWQYMDSSSSSSLSFWQTYTPQSDITSGGFSQDGTISSCSDAKTQSSTLQRHLVAEDSGRTYRCMARRGSGSLQEQFAGTQTLGTVTEDGTSNTTPSASTGTSSADVGSIVGGVIGALLVIAVIIVIVYFLVIRPRQQKKREEEYMDGGGEEKGDDKEAVPPYSAGADPTVIYSQPNKRSKDKTRDSDKASEEKEGGKTNKALDDDTDEKKDKSSPTTTTTTKPLTPDDNDDRRHGRRSKDKKKNDTTATTGNDPHSDYLPHHRDDRQDRRHRDDDRYDDGRYDNYDDRRGGGYNDDRGRGYGDDRRTGGTDRRRPKDGDGYDDDRAAPRSDGYGGGGSGGRRNRGFESDGRSGGGRRGGRGHHSSSEDGGTDHSQLSMGDGDPTIGTSI